MEIKKERLSPSLCIERKPVTVTEDDESESEAAAVEDSDDLEAAEENKLLSHQQAMEQFKDALAEIVVGDPLLNDLHTEVTLEEVKSQIALEHGKAITVNIRRADNIVLPVVVVHNATVLDLKKAIQRHVILRQARENGTEHLSWRYVWRAYWLYFNNQKLTDDSKPLKDYGIGNKDELTFIKRLRAH